MLIASDFGELGMLGLAAMLFTAVCVVIGLIAGLLIGAKTRWYYGVLATVVIPPIVFVGVMLTLRIINYVMYGE